METIKFKYIYNLSIVTVSIAVLFLGYLSGYQI